MTDQELTNFLRNLQTTISQALKTGFDSLGQRSAGSTKKPAKKDSKPDFEKLNKQVEQTTAALKETADQSENLSDKIEVTAGKFEELGGKVGVVSGNFSALNTAIQNIASSMGTLNLESLEEANGASSTLGALTQNSLGLDDAFQKLTGSALALKDAFDLLAGASKTSKDAVKATVAPIVENSSAVQSSTKAINQNVDANKDAIKETSKSSQFFDGALSRLGIGLDDTADKSEWLSGKMKRLGTEVMEAIINVTRDVFHLQARGISAGDSMMELYGNAMKAGMSLQDYTAMLQENSAAVVRADSFEEFGDSLDRTTRQLNRLGVFGPAAEQLAASLRNNAVILGINTAAQDEAISSQVELFGQLRKSTMMTADAFRELQADISNNQSVQEELLGLAPAERAARLAQIQQGATIGYQLGATAQASKQLQDALLAQRRATVKDRFKAAGTIRMGGAILGMDTSRAEEYSKLMLKNPALRTAEDKKRIAELAGDYQQFMQALKSSPNPALENIADELGALAPAVQGELQSAAGAVKLQTEAGAALNAETGQQATGFMQDIGRGFTALSGFMKNPMAEAMVTFASILAQTVIQSSLLAIIAKNTGSTGRIFDLFGKKGAPLGKKPDIVGPSKPDMLKNPLAWSKMQVAQSTTISALSGIGKFITSFASSARSIATGILQVYRSFGFITGTASLIIDGISVAGKVFGTIKGLFGIIAKGGFLGGIFSAVEELFTGEMTAALGFGDRFGGRILGAVTSFFNGLFTGFTRIIDDGINWVAEGLGFSWRSNITRLVDDATLAVVSTFKIIGSFFSQGWHTFKIGFLELIADMLTSIPGVSEEAPWVKSLRASQKQSYDIVKNAEEERMQVLNDYSNKREQLYTGETTTLRSMGEQQIKAQKETAEETTKLIKSSKDATVMGVENALSAALSTASSLQAQSVGSSTKPAEVQAAPAKQPGTAIATLQPQQQPRVTPPEVNKQQMEAEKPKTENTGYSEMTVIGMQQLIANTQQQLDVLRQMLALNMKQLPGEEPIPEPRAIFTDNTQLYSRLISA